MVETGVELGLDEDELVERELVLGTLNLKTSKGMMTLNPRKMT
jgi:hypothetical protein